jgi:hypothetical protein
MTKYNLINPYIDGSLETTINVSSKSSVLEAAGQMYKDVLAPIFITAAGDNFNFSMEGGGKIHHFTVSETVSNDNAKFKISEFKGNVDNKKLTKKINEINELSGGKRKHRHKDDDSSSSSSSSDSPPYYSINRYYYSPYIYTPYVSTYSTYYTVPIISPVNIGTNTYWSIYTI